MIKAKDYYFNGEYGITFFYNDTEIARFCIGDGILSIKSEGIEGAYGSTIFDKALNGEWKEAYKKLFSMLNIKDHTKLRLY